MEICRLTANSGPSICNSPGLFEQLLHHGFRVCRDRPVNRFYKLGVEEASQSGPNLFSTLTSERTCDTSDIGIYPVHVRDTFAPRNTAIFSLRDPCEQPKLPSDLLSIREAFVITLGLDVDVEKLCILCELMKRSCAV